MQTRTTTSSLYTHVFGFLFMLSLGFMVVIAVDYYDVSVSDVAQAAGTLFFLQQ